MKNIIKKITSATLVSAMALLSTPSFASPTFSDVANDDWYYSSVNYAVSNNLFNGTSDTTFSPSTAMTRGMFVTVLGRLDNINIDNYTSISFSDVETGAYYAPYVEWASNEGIVSGVSENDFAPNEAITREQITKILYGYAMYTGKIPLDYTINKLMSFNDYNSVSNWAVTGMAWATTNEIINGSDNAVRPQDTATRAEVATIFMNLSKSYDLISNPTVEPTSEPTTSLEPTTEPTSTPIATAEPTPTTIPDDEMVSPTPTIAVEPMETPVVKDEWEQRPTGFSAFDTDGGFYNYAESNASFEEINKMRVEADREELAYSLILQKISDVRAKELAMMNYNETYGTSHIRPDGSDIRTLSSFLGGENTLWGGTDALKTIKESGMNPEDIDVNTLPYTLSTYTVDETTGRPHFEDIDTVYMEVAMLDGKGNAEQWYNSTGHRANLLNGAYKSSAVSSYTDSNGQAYCVQIFSNSSVPLINEYADTNVFLPDWAK